MTKVIPPLLAGRDVLGVVPSDAGSETGYSLLAIERVRDDGPAYNPTALILVPDRERAIQVHETVFQLSDRGSVASALGVFEGKPVTSQIGPLKHGVDIIVGTTGRVLEHVKRKTLRIEQLKILVLDRVDEMLDQGLGRDVEAIIASTPKTRQTVLFSATSPKGVLAMARDHLRDPELIGIESATLEAEAPHRPDRGNMVNLYFGAGKGAGVSPRDLLGAVTNEGGLNGEQVGAITIKQNFSLVAVPDDQADALVSKLRNSRLRGRKVTVRRERFRKKPH